MMLLLLLLFLSYRVQSMESMVAGTAAMHGTTTHWPHRISATPPHVYDYKYKEVVLLLLRKTFMHYICFRSYKSIGETIQNTLQANILKVCIFSVQFFYFFLRDTVLYVYSNICA